jgi:hypothetical protein
LPSLISIHEELRKPFRSLYNDNGNALERDVRDALDQILSGLPYILKMNKTLVDKRGNSFKIDLLVIDGKSNRRYAIIECKNIHSKKPYTNEVELRKAAHPLSFFKDDKSLKICIVNKRRKLSDGAKRKIDHLFKFQVKGKIYDWSTELDWLKMAYSVRKTILSHYGWKEKIGFCAKLLSYAENELDTPTRKRRKFLMNIGIKNAHGMVWAYDKKKKEVS